MQDEVKALRERELEREAVSVRRDFTGLGQQDSGPLVTEIKPSLTSAVRLHQSGLLHNAQNGSTQPPKPVRAARGISHEFMSPAQRNTNAWVLSPSERAEFGVQFDTIDTERNGYISGEQFNTFFRVFRLEQHLLGEVWGLADIGAKGDMSRDEFAVAMLLVQRHLQGHVLPHSLPQTLIPATS